jgi:hypothetical protein
LIAELLKLITLRPTLQAAHAVAQLLGRYAGGVAVGRDSLQCRLARITEAPQGGGILLNVPDRQFDGDGIAGGYFIFSCTRALAPSMISSARIKADGCWA